MCAVCNIYIIYVENEQQYRNKIKRKKFIYVSNAYNRTYYGKSAFRQCNLCIVFVVYSKPKRTNALRKITAPIYNIVYGISIQVSLYFSETIEFRSYITSFFFVLFKTVIVVLRISISDANENHGSYYPENYMYLNSLYVLIYKSTSL